MRLVFAWLHGLLEKLASSCIQRQVRVQTIDVTIDFVGQRPDPSLSSRVALDAGFGCRRDTAQPAYR